MAVEPTRREGWQQGINNKANWRDMPEGTVRDAVNVDALPSGSLALRTGFESVYPGTRVRGALAVGSDILIADGDRLVCLDTTSATTTELATIAVAGRFAGAVLNAELFLCTENQTLRYRAGVLREWGVPTVTAQPVPVVGVGALLGGTYQLAVTYTNAYGEEGGTTQAVRVKVPTGGSLVVTLDHPPNRPDLSPNLYLSAVDGSTLYWQCAGAGEMVLSVVDDATQVLLNMHLSAPAPGSIVTEAGGVLAIADGSVVHLTEPMSPHLRRPAAAFFQFPEPVTAMVGADRGLYVSADKTYFLTGVGGPTPEQSEVFPFPMVPGTAVALPTGGAGWMTPYGLAVTTAPGQAKLLSEQNFVPELADAGSSGIVETNGAQLAVTTLRGDRGNNPLAARDYYEAEIVAP